jgi:hypothetical protein
MSRAIRAPWLLACRHVIPDGLTGQLNAVGILDQVPVARLPCVVQSFGLLMRLERDDAQGPARVDVKFNREDAESEDMVCQTWAEFLPGEWATHAFVSFRVLRARVPGPLVFSSRWKGPTGRWKAGPKHSMQVVLNEGDGATAYLAAMDEMPPLG